MIQIFTLHYMQSIGTKLNDLDLYIHTYIYEIYNTLHSRG